MKKNQMRLVRLFVSPREARKLRRQKKKLSLKFLINSRKGQDLIQYVPSQVMIDILSRLPILSIMRCKCVCKSWLDLIKSDEFVNSHLSKSVPGLAVFEEEYVRRHPSLYDVYVPTDEFGNSLCLDVYEEEYGRRPSLCKEFIELVDGVDLNCRWKIDLNVFNVPGLRLHSCANCLIFLHGTCHHIICNPVTREYFMLPSPPRPSSSSFELYGFGVSRMSGQYKVIRILDEEISRRFIECLQVYTIGSGGCRWRSITPPTGLPEGTCTALGAFLRGNLHFHVKGSGKRRIYCIDLETELLSAFSVPPNLDDYYAIVSLSVLRDCLCACGYSFIAHKSDIWLMKEYGDEKSWTNELSVRRDSMYDSPLSSCLCPIKVFENGDILMEDNYDGRSLFYFSSKTATIREARDVFGLGSNINYNNAMIYTPTFLSLNTNFPMENVFSF